MKTVDVPSRWPATGQVDSVCETYSRCFAHVTSRSSTVREDVSSERRDVEGSGGDE